MLVRKGCGIAFIACGTFGSARAVHQTSRPGSLFCLSQSCTGKCMQALESRPTAPGATVPVDGRESWPNLVAGCSRRSRCQDSFRRAPSNSLLSARSPFLGCSDRAHEFGRNCSWRSIISANSASQFFISSRGASMQTVSARKDRIRVKRAMRSIRPAQRCNSAHPTRGCLGWRARTE